MADELQFRFTRYRGWGMRHWQLISQYVHVLPIWLKSTQSGHYPLQMGGHPRQRPGEDILSWPGPLIGHVAAAQPSHWPQFLLVVFVWVATPEKPTTYWKSSPTLWFRFNVRHPVVVMSRSQNSCAEFITFPLPMPFSRICTICKCSFKFIQICQLYVKALVSSLNT